MKYLTPILVLCVSLLTHAQTPSVTTPLIKCVPSDTSLFGFELSRVKGCSFTPGGPHCGNSIGIAIFGFDHQAQAWVHAGDGSFFPDTADLNTEQKTFNYNFVSSSEKTHIQVSLLEGSSVVDISLPVGFQNVPEVNTHGVQTSYQCSLF